MKNSSFPRFGCFRTRRPPVYSKLPRAQTPVERAGSAIASLRGKTIQSAGVRGAVELSLEAQLAVRAAEGALITGGLLEPSSMMRTRFLNEIIELCWAGVPMDDPQLVRLWSYK